MSDLVEFVSTIIRPGLWCDTCMTSNRVEADVYSSDDDGVGVVATMEGCRRCQTGMCAETGDADGI